jgi:hypothetical protein
MYVYVRICGQLLCEPRGWHINISIKPNANQNAPKRQKREAQKQTSATLPGSWAAPVKENTQERGVYFVLYVFVLYFVLYLYFLAATARAPAPAPASSLVQGTLLGNAATASMDRRDRVAAAVLAAGPITKPKQAMLFFHNVSSTKASSQNVRGDCVFCGETRASSGATRFMEHLLICNLAPRNIKQGFRALTEKKCEKQAEAEKRMRETLRAEEN